MMNAYKIEIAPTPAQAHLMRQCCAAARVVYNWGLAQQNEYYERTGKHCTNIELSRRLTQEKRTNPDLQWLNTVPARVTTYALEHLEAGWQKYFRWLKTQKGPEIGPPHFKKRDFSRSSFTVQGASASLAAIVLPRIGTIPYREHGYIPEDIGDTRNQRVTVSERIGRWWVSVQGPWTVPEDYKTPEAPFVGVDIGVHVMAWAADAEGKDWGRWYNPKPLAHLLPRLQRLQRQLNRKPHLKILQAMHHQLSFCKDPTKRARFAARIAQLERQRNGDVSGYKNREKLRRRIAALHFRIEQVRRAAIHCATTALVRRHEGIVRETLHVKGLMRGPRMGRSLSDVSMGEFDRQLTYKSTRYERTLIKADRFYPSSKECSDCHTIMRDLPRKAETYHCPVCQLQLPRDFNAAINLARIGASQKPQP
jgi:putative transposase